MKRLLAITVLILTIGIIYFIYISVRHQVIGTELKITFVNSQKHNDKDLASEYSINELEWFILHDTDHVKNWEKFGYVVPQIDFKNHYLIMSKYKILKLYQKPGCDECTGVPDGEAIFDKENSDKGSYYFYLMPKVMLSQGVG